MSRMSASTHTLRTHARARFHLVFRLLDSFFFFSYDLRSQQTIDPNAIESSGELSSGFCFCVYFAFVVCCLARWLAEWRARSLRKRDRRTAHTVTQQSLCGEIDEANHKTDEKKSSIALAGWRNAGLVSVRESVCVRACARALLLRLRFSFERGREKV